MNIEEMAILIVMLVTVFGLPLVLKGIFKLLGIPHIPKEFEADKAQVVCGSNTYIYSFVMLLSGVLGVMMACVSIGLALEGEPAGMMLAFLAIAFMAMAVGFFVIIKNRVILLFTDKIIFRDTFGKVFLYTTQQVVGYVYVRGGKQRYIRVRMNDNKNIHIEDEGAKLYDALAFVQANYPEL